MANRSEKVNTKHDASIRKFAQELEKESQKNPARIERRKATNKNVGTEREAVRGSTNRER